MLATYLGVLAMAAALTEAAVVRLCVTAGAEGPCADMLKDPSAAGLNVECVSGHNRYECMRMVAAKEADVVAVNGEDVFMARELYNGQVHVIAETRVKERQDDPWRYQGVAVVRRSTITSLADLKGAKSCHTGYARTAGWNIPFSHLLQKELITMQCDGPEATVVEHDIRAASAFFGPSCLPGSWTPDNATDVVLKQRYQNMCSLCAMPNVCGQVDLHAGYQGSLRCLVDGNGDVAWTKLSAVREFFKARPEVALSDYGLLCPDGRVLEVSPSPKLCNWASRPWNSWLARAANENKKGIVAALTRMMEAAIPSPELEQDLRPWAYEVLWLRSPSVIFARNPPITPRDFLKEHKYDTTIERLGCPEVPVKLCVESHHALEKCQAFGHVLKSRRIRPRLECTSPVLPDDCLDMVAAGVADITTADGGDVFRAHREHQLTPVLSERHGLLDASYYAVAVVRANSGITSFRDLRGKNSCHTGIGKTAGWKIPVVTLLEAGLLDAGSCDFPGEMGSFFNHSCAPGAKDSRFDPIGSNPQSLCDLCVGNTVEGVAGPAYSVAPKGNENDKCARSSAEAFYGYTGAFRCLVQGGGDVAFVKHTTVGDNTNGNNNASWAVNLRAVDFKLLCNNSGTADVVEFSSCYLAQVPAHKVLTGLADPSVMREEVRIMLLGASRQFPRGQDVFPMFGPFRGRSDLIFKDSATELIDVRTDDFHTSLDNSYYRTLAKMEDCQPKETSMAYTSSAGVLSLPTLHIVLCVSLAWLINH